MAYHRPLTHEEAQEPLGNVYERLLEDFAAFAPGKPPGQWWREAEEVYAGQGATAAGCYTSCAKRQAGFECTCGREELGQLLADHERGI